MTVCRTCLVFNRTHVFYTRRTCFVLIEPCCTCLLLIEHMSSINKTYVQQDVFLTSCRTCIVSHMSSIERCDTMFSAVFQRANLGVAGLRAAIDCVRVWVRARPHAQRRFEQEPAGGKWCSIEAGMLGQMTLW